MEIKKLSKITSKLMTDKPNGHGCECNVYFIPDTNIVAKHYVGHGGNDYGMDRMELFTAKELATFAYRMSIYAAHHGFGPKVFGFDKKENILYVERADSWKCIDEDVDYADLFSNIDKKLKEISHDEGANFTDPHGGNIGRTANGKWVIIDMGYLGWRKFKPAKRMLAEIFSKKKLHQMFRAQYYSREEIQEVIMYRERYIRIKKWAKNAMKGR